MRETYQLMPEENKDEKAHVSLDQNETTKSGGRALIDKESSTNKSKITQPHIDSDYAQQALSNVNKSDSLVGKVLNDKYTFVDVLGEGAMATVYRARHNSTGKMVAIKTLRYADPSLAQRFAREVEIHSKLKHENIVEAIDCITVSNQQSFFVMELLVGSTLEALLQRGRFNNPHQIASILAQTCNALECAHQQGIIHRDVKPENIIVNEIGAEQHVKVLDFGIAKVQEDLQRLTKTGVVLGSPAYMSPEQCMGEELDPRSDMYSLAVVAYEMVTGSLPFDAQTPIEMMEAHCTPEVEPDPIAVYRPDFPAIQELQLVLYRALSTEPDDRHQSIDDLKRELAQWWKAATANQPGLDCPFQFSATPRVLKNKSKNKKDEKQRVVNTMEVKSLNRIVEKQRNHQEQSMTGQIRMEPAQEMTRVVRQYPLLGWALFVIMAIALSSLCAFGLISFLQNIDSPSSAPLQSNSITNPPPSQAPSPAPTPAATPTAETPTEPAPSDTASSDPKYADPALSLPSPEEQEAAEKEKAGKGKRRIMNTWGN